MRVNLDEVMFLPNGCTAYFRNGQQVPDLQVPWLRLYLEFLVANHVDPMLTKLRTPDGNVWVPFKTSEGHWSWELLEGRT